ncbi:MAG: hypothetical protein AB7O57_18805 [Hyphomicrobiaceae bacterium]
MKAAGIRLTTLALGGALALAALLSPGDAAAQSAGLSQRDCQTVRTCNFSRYGAVRGCLSSYTCRTCRAVRSRCNLAGLRYCERVVCGWGG